MLGLQMVLEGLGVTSFCDPGQTQISYLEALPESSSSEVGKERTSLSVTSEPLLQELYCFVGFMFSLFCFL